MFLISTCSNLRSRTWIKKNSLELKVARPFFMSSLWHHVSIPAEVDGFLIPSPHVAATLCPRFHSLSLQSLSLSLLFILSLSPLSLSSLSSLPLSDGLLRRSLSLKQVFFFDVGCRSPRRVSRLHNVDDSRADPVYRFNPPPLSQFLRKTISRPPSRSDAAHARDVTVPACNGEGEL